MVSKICFSPWKVNSCDVKEKKHDAHSLGASAEVHAPCFSCTQSVATQKIGGGLDQAIKMGEATENTGNWLDQWS